MDKVNENRMFLRVKYSRETDEIFSDNIPKYADWLETKLAELNEQNKSLGYDDAYERNIK